MTDHGAEDTDDDAGVFAISEDLVQSPTHKQPSTHRVDLDGVLQETPLLLSEDLAKGNGGQAWPAGRVLAKYLLRTKQSELKQARSMFVVRYGSVPREARQHGS